MEPLNCNKYSFLKTYYITLMCFISLWTVKSLSWQAFAIHPSLEAHWNK